MSGRLRRKIANRAGSGLGSRGSMVRAFFMHHWILLHIPIFTGINLPIVYPSLSCIRSHLSSTFSFSYLTCLPLFSFHRIIEVNYEKETVTMHISSGIIAAVLGTSWFVDAAPTEPSASEFLLELNDKATSQLESSELQFSTRSSRKTCTIANASVRRDW